ncbi:unnamed protein product [Arabis nemorensis]|uniref:Uncharacterized protein n=1 Tax=Arabis nemorensis TaxID=586526 RepID=A0A565BGW4_9BRAS|nr:unnamed protein product [Arabis nemorensis]
MVGCRMYRSPYLEKRSVVMVRVDSHSEVVAGPCQAPLPAQLPLPFPVFQLSIQAVVSAYFAPDLLSAGHFSSVLLSKGLATRISMLVMLSSPKACILGPLCNALPRLVMLWSIPFILCLTSLGGSLIDESGYCFVVALTRGRLPVDEFLSVQDFINKLPRNLVNESGITDLKHATDTLRNKGLLLERHGPVLTFEPGRRGAIIYTRRCICSDTGYFKDTWYENIRSQRMLGPVTVSVIWFPSYSGRERDGSVLTPTREEVARHLAKPKKGQVHTMLLCGDGVDEHLVPFWELQESSGDRGYLRLSGMKDPSLILEYVLIEV